MLINGPKQLALRLCRLFLLFLLPSSFYFYIR